MTLKGWKSIAAVTTLVLGGAMANTPFPVRAIAFVQEFERTSKGGNQVSFWERVVYSLIEANDRGADCRAPRNT